MCVEIDALLLNFLVSPNHYSLSTYFISKFQVAYSEYHNHIFCCIRRIFISKFSTEILNTISTEISSNTPKHLALQIAVLLKDPLIFCSPNSCHKRRYKYLLRHAHSPDNLEAIILQFIIFHPVAT